MTEELKTVRCGCGGEAEVTFESSSLYYTVHCKKCEIETYLYDSEAEAIKAWNRAMGAKDINVPDKERTAKVPYCPERYYCDDALKLMVMNIFGDYIYATHDIDLEKLREALNTLLERDQRIMFMRYQNCETLENIGKEFGVTCERIRQIIARALRILRHPKFKIAKAKPAEPERKKGKWNNYKDDHSCSVCHSVVIQENWSDENQYDFCPYCGSEMRGDR